MQAVEYSTRGTGAQDCTPLVHIFPVNISGVPCEIIIAKKRWQELKVPYLKHQMHAELFCIITNFSEQYPS
jgi:hypothetical protein